MDNIDKWLRLTSFLTSSVICYFLYIILSDHSDLSEFFKITICFLATITHQINSLFSDKQINKLKEEIENLKKK